MKNTLLILALALLVSCTSKTEQKVEEATEKVGETLDTLAEKAKAGLDSLTTPGRDDTTVRADEHKVNVTLADGKITMPSTLQAGWQAFEVKNTGTKDHNFEIEGNGVHEQFSLDVDPGEQKVMRVELKPGTYSVYCPVSDHKDKGMATTVTVK